MNKINILNLITDKKLIISVIVLITSMIFYKALSMLINLKIKNLNNTHKTNYRKQKTYLKLLNNIIRYLLLILDFIIILNIYGVNVSSLIAGLGIVSIVTGLALQDALKDIISGFNIMLDCYYSIGDVIKIDDIEGKVIDVKLKVTKIRDVNTDNILVIANRNIVKSIIISNLLDIDIPLPYEENVERIENILNEIIENFKINDKIDNIKYIGLNQFADSAIIYKIRVWTKPEFKGQIKRDILREIKLKLDSNNIRIPYNQLDINYKPQNKN